MRKYKEDLKNSWEEIASQDVIWLPPASTKKKLTRWTRLRDIVRVPAWFWGSSRRTVRSDSFSLKTKVGVCFLSFLLEVGLGGGIFVWFYYFFFWITELRTSLEEHQSAVELIMTKYREQVFRLLMASKRDDPAIVSQLKEQHTTVSASHDGHTTKTTCF